MRRAARTELRILHRLARLYGVQPAYVDGCDSRRTASPEVLLAIVRALGAPIHTRADAGQAIRAREEHIWSRGVNPVTVVWLGGPARVRLRLPARLLGDAARVAVTTEDGETVTDSFTPEACRIIECADISGTKYAALSAPLPRSLPTGYHAIAITVGRLRADGMLIVAPRRVYQGENDQRGACWGAFLPLYALHSRESWGIGDLSDLERLARWIARGGGQCVATLPLLTTYMDAHDTPSPYLPASRLFWNEIFIDPRRTPEWEQCPAAQAFANGDAMQIDLNHLNTEPLIDYHGVSRIKRRVLEALADVFFNNSARPDTFDVWRRESAYVDEYARFRAVRESQGPAWRTWPATMRPGELRPDGYGEAAYRYHLYAQWTAHSQLEHLATNDEGAPLHLDLPLGVHPDGYDTWRWRDNFVDGMRVGAPPDAFFTQGQDWGFPPQLPAPPDRCEYFRAVIGAQMRYAAMVRIDHIMGLHRTYWIPEGASAAEGTYVTCPADVFYAILTVESHRARCRVVGEDLGTVPRAVRTMMERRGVSRMYVLPFARNSASAPGLRTPTPHSVASLNTHDLAPFAAFWSGDDIRRASALGRCPAAEANRLLAERRTFMAALVRELTQQGVLTTQPESVDDALRACLAYLGRSPAEYVLVNLEDLWGETAPQNIPGTTHEYPNWRRPARLSLEEMTVSTTVNELLAMLDNARTRSPAA